LGGILTTVEGLLEKIIYHLRDHNPFVDSDHEFGERMRDLLAKMTDMQRGEK